MKRIVGIAIVAMAVVLILVPAAGADVDNYHGLWPLTPTIPCGEGATFNVFEQADVQAGSVHCFTVLYGPWVFAPQIQAAACWPEDVAFRTRGERTFHSPRDGGWLDYTITVINPDHTQASHTTLHAECPSGTLVITREGVPDIAGPVTEVPQPESFQRLTMTVTQNTPLYSAPDPNAVLPDYVLTAGQGWFVVGQVIGTDGLWWLEVFTGGPNNAYVPASAFGFVQTGPFGDEFQTGPLGDQFQTGPLGDQFQTGPFGDEFQTGPFGDEFE